MKQHLFTIAEGRFYALVNHVVSYLREGYADHDGGPMIVGGLAVQLHVMDMTIKAGLSPDCSHFRKTDDIDLDFPAPVSKVILKEAVHTMPHLEAEVGGTLVLAEPVRSGEVKPIIKMTVFTNDDEISEEVKLNLSVGPQDLHGFKNGYHLARHSRKVTVSFPHVSVKEKASFPVVGLEDLIVTKMANGREKDEKDLSTIAQVVKTTKRELNLGLMEASLGDVKDHTKRLEARQRYKEFLAKIGKNGRNGNTAPRKPLRQTVR